MSEDPKKYLWFTDTHLDVASPWALLSFLKTLKLEKPAGIFLTGDISNGILTCYHLKMLAKAVTCPIYFVLGNHDIWFGSFDKRLEDIRNVCREYPNLVWVTESDIVGLNEEVAVIGADGWYDAEIGEAKYLKYSLDQVLIDDFRKLPYFDAKIEAFRHLADKSTKLISEKLEQALELDYKTIYILTHMPPWKEATRDESSLLKDFWLPYNTNIRLGRAIEQIMETRKKRNVIVLSGHTHHPEFIRISRNIHCQVGRAEIGKIKSQWIYI